MSFQYSVDRRLGRNAWTIACPHLAEDGIGSVFAEDALLFELLADRQYALFEFIGGSVGGFRRPVGLVGPVDTIQTLSFCPGDPKFNGRRCDAELFSRLAKGLSFSRGGDDGPSLLWSQPLVFVLSSCP